MASYLQKSYIKYLLIGLGCLFLAVVILTFSINVFLARSWHKLEGKLAESFGRDIRIEKINFLPPNAVVLKKVSFLQETNKSFVSIPKVKLKFSLLKIFAERNFTPKAIVLYRPKADYQECQIFVKKNFVKIVDFLLSLPQSERFSLVVKKAQLALPRTRGVRREIILDNNLRIIKKSIYNQGSLHFNPTAARDSVLDSAELPAETVTYFLQGRLEKEGLEIEKIKFDKGPFSIKLWGDYKNSQQTVYLNGVATRRNFFAEAIPQKLGLSPFDKFKQAMYKLSGGHIVIGPSPLDLYIYDLRCVLAMQFPVLSVKTLEFSLRDTFVRLQGKVAFLDPTSIDLSLVSSPRVKAVHGQSDCEFRISGTLKKNSFNGKTKVKLPAAKDNFNKPRELETTFRNLIFDFSEYSRPDFFAKNVKALYKVGNNRHKLSFDDFHCTISGQKRLKRLELNSGLYDGLLQGKGYLDMTKLPLSYKLDLKLQDVSSEKLKSFLDYFSKIEGKLASNIKLHNYPQFRIQGDMFIEDGYLNDFVFFQWLAGFFKLPELEQISFESCLADFLVTNQLAQLKNIKLVSADTEIKGYFSLLAEELVSSKLSLKLSRGILTNSPKFKSLLKLIGKDFTDLTFDFQLSGFFQDMNFKWMDSYFKKRLQASIPDFIERGIERKISDIGRDNP